MRLKDKIAIITAAGSGAGRAGAVLFAKEGAKVVVADIDINRGKETVSIIKDAGGESISAQVDVGKVEDIRRLIDTAADAYGKINVLWNHAGIPGPGILEDTGEAEFDRSIAVNAKGGFFAAKFVVPHMKKAGGGSIIFTATTAALRASLFSPSYALAKGGLIPLTFSLAAYLGPYNIRTNCLCPAAIDTPMLPLFIDRTGHTKAEDIENAKRALAQKSPLGRLARAEDIANAALFLASDESCYVNGVILPLDGGIITKQ
jgi:NAD(P)-dependent dehydrogenase (short-subunit alcohol dehydrogenase family)